jgi:flagellar protein FlaJ
MDIYITESKMNKIQMIGIALGVSLLGGMILMSSYIPEAPYWIPVDRNLNTGIVFSILLMIAPRAIIEWNNKRYLTSIDKKLPIFLRDVTNSVQSGVPLLIAIEQSSLNDYGPLNVHLRLAVNRINLTSDIDSSLIWMGEKLITSQAKRLCYILIEAYNTGGSIVEILETSLDTFININKTRIERETLVSPYLSIVFLGNFIFLLISWVILQKFLGSLVEMQLSYELQLSNMFSSETNVNYYWSILFWASTIESLAGGLFGGKIKHGSLKNGLIYSSMLMIITILFFNSPIF